MFRSATVEYPSNIESSSLYYYITDDALSKGLITLVPGATNALSIKTTNLSQIPECGNFYAIKKTHLDALSLDSFDVNIAYKFPDSEENRRYIFHEGKPLSKIVNTNILKSPEISTHAFTCGGETVINTPQAFYELKNGLLLSKFTDPQVITKLTKALNEAFKCYVSNTSRISYTFVLYDPKLLGENAVNDENKNKGDTLPPITHHNDLPKPHVTVDVKVNWPQNYVHKIYRRTENKS